jgi:hypothetical protein
METITTALDKARAHRPTTALVAQKPYKLFIMLLFLSFFLLTIYLLYATISSLPPYMLFSPSLPFFPLLNKPTHTY